MKKNSDGQAKMKVCGRIYNVKCIRVIDSPILRRLKSHGATHLYTFGSNSINSFTLIRSLPTAGLAFPSAVVLVPY